MTKRSGDYEIGYGKPPVWTRYRKGQQSPNPKGRPRKKKEAEPVAGLSMSDRLLRQELDRKVMITDAGRKKEVTLLEALQRAQFKAAFEGSPTAQRDLKRDARELEIREAELAEQAAMEEAVFFERVVELQQLQRRIWDAAEARGEEPDNPWPHPDDILLDHFHQSVKIRGPLDEGEVITFEYYEAERDAAFAEAELAFRGRMQPGLLKDVIWMLWDSLLPLRWQFAPRIERQRFNVALLGTARLRRFRDERRADADILRPLANLPSRSKETYRLVNSMMKPGLRMLGYRSLAEFESAHKAHPRI